MPPESTRNEAVVHAAVRCILRGDHLLQPGFLGTSGMAGFSVASLMKETVDVVTRFAAYYERIGADRILLYIDAPLDAAVVSALEEKARSAPTWEVHFCDEAFWKDLGHSSRPVDFHVRQSAVYAHALSIIRSDWLFACDADEFIIDRMPVAEFLDRVPDHVDSVGIPPAEAVWGPGEDLDTPFGSTWFRRPAMDSRLDALFVYGPWSIFIKNGLMGHTSGKQFLRRGALFDRIGSHFAYRDGRRITVWASTLDPPLASVEVAHFDAISLPRWDRKFEGNVRNEMPGMMMRLSPRRRLQHRVYKLCSSLGPRAVRAMFRRMYSIDRRQVRYLAKRDLVFQLDLFARRGSRRFLERPRP